MNPIMKCRSLLVILLRLSLLQYKAVSHNNVVHAWITIRSTTSLSQPSQPQYRRAMTTNVLPQTNGTPSLLTSQHRTICSMAGFGDTSASESKEIKLKPKQQWDRYTALKKEKSVIVGVKVLMALKTVADGTVDNEWLVVGAVKCESSIPFDVAVARQRALLVEHAKRLYPLQISPKAQIEWGYLVPDDESDNTTGGSTTMTATNNQWMTVDKTVLDTVPSKGIEKQMGFVGTPDPTTGFYCVYNEGRLVTSSGIDSSSAVTKPSSKKLG